MINFQVNEVDSHVVPVSASSMNYIYYRAVEGHAGERRNRRAQQ